MDKNSAVLIKQQVLELCLQAQTQRAEHARKAMEEAQLSANQEERSTAGDKYDTSRAMSQNVRDMNARQLQEALKEMALLQQINPHVIFQQVKPGSLVKTSMGNYFIATSGGPYQIDKESYFSVSALSPIGDLLMHKKKGDTFIFRGKMVSVTEVF
jgi:transcription elongation GreA/GreB family factor